MYHQGTIVVKKINKPPESQSKKTYTWQSKDLVARELNASSAVRDKYSY